MDSETIPSVVTDALWVRRWALELLRGAEPSARAIGQVNRASEFALGLAFELERCALAVHTRLERHGGSNRLAEPVRAVLEAYRFRELKRAMSVRAQLERIAEIARSRGAKLAVLKGGVAIGEGRYLDAADVDVLAHPAEAPRFAEWLVESEPHQVTGRDLPFRPRGVKHLAQRRAENSVQVEIHYSVPGIGSGAVILPRAEPLHGISGLHRLNAEDHLFHLLYHTTISHPDRAGRLRDLLLIEEARRALSDDQARAVERRLASISAAANARRVLATAEGLQRSEGGALDPFTAIASANYLLWSVAKLGGRPISLQLFGSVFHLVGGYREYARWMVGSLLVPDVRARHELFHRLVGWSPLLSRSLRGVSRPPRIAAVLPRALKLARQAKTLAERWEHEAG